MNGTNTTFPPYPNAPHNSHTEKSKAIEWNSVHTSPGTKSNHSRVADNNRAMLRCSTITPLGLPVDPEV